MPSFHNRHVEQKDILTENTETAALFTAFFEKFLMAVPYFFNIYILTNMVLSAC